MKRKWTRRAFLAMGSLAGTGLVVGVSGLAYLNRKIEKYSGKGLGLGTSLNAWIRIAPDNTVILAIPRVEMGQGVYTALPMMVAEELEVEMDQLKIVHPQAESPYTNLFMVTQQPPDILNEYSLTQKFFSYLTIVATGGSTSVADAFNNLRYAGASAREMLKNAAAHRWKIAASNCIAHKGTVTNTINQQMYTYGELAEEAALIDLGDMPPLKRKQDWEILGKSIPRLDIPAKVNGSAVFALDVRMDNLHFAVFRNPAVLGGKIIAIKNRGAVEHMKGVKKVLLTEYGVAVVATNTWYAKKAVDALVLEEQQTENHQLSSAAIMQKVEQLLDEPPEMITEEIGSVDTTIFDTADQIIEAKYYAPFLAHAPLETVSCTALLANNELQLWLGHQSISNAQAAASKVTGLDESKITLHGTFLGGAFGRKGEIGIVLRAAAVSKALPGIPVMTIYTREEDMRKSIYRPASTSIFKASVGASGKIDAWYNKLVSQSAMKGAMARSIPPMYFEGMEAGITDGARDLPYTMANRKIEMSTIEIPVPVGPMRSVDHGLNAYFTECFMDECAKASGTDPLIFRKSKLKHLPQFLIVLEKLEHLSNWHRDLPDGKFRGMAIHKSFGTLVGQVVEITHLADKEFSIDRYYCIVDCGTYINPDMVKAQMEGSIIFGLSAALYGEITWEGGQVVQQNFPQYNMVRMAVAPEITVEILENDNYPSGVGEPGVPPATPALANAIFSATGEPVRSLPLTKQGFRFV